jgi:hypothetical protein
MKRFLLFVLPVLTFSASAPAQTGLPNAGFETWINKGSYEDPQDWGTVNSQTAILGIKTVVKATAAEAHSGTYALKLITKFIGIPFNQKIPGLCATGTINTTTKAIDGGFPYTLRPEKISGWYKYSPAGKDTASVSIALSKWDAVAHKRIVIGSASFKDTATVGKYTAFSASINYVSSLTPDTAMLIVLSSQQTSGVLNSTLWVDDLSLDMPTGLNLQASISEMGIYPNPANTVLFISTPHAVETKFVLIDMKGSKVLENNLLHSGYIDISALKEGTYLYQFFNTDKQLLQSGKLIINTHL